MLGRHLQRLWMIEVAGFRDGGVFFQMLPNCDFSELAGFRRQSGSLGCHFSDPVCPILQMADGFPKRNFVTSVGLLYHLLCCLPLSSFDPK